MQIPAAAQARIVFAAAYLLMSMGGAIHAQESETVEVGVRVGEFCVFDLPGGGGVLNLNFGTYDPFSSANVFTNRVVVITCSESGVLQAVASLGEGWIRSHSVEDPSATRRMIRDPSEAAGLPYAIGAWTGHLGRTSHDSGWWANEFDGGGWGGRVYEASVQAGSPLEMNVRARLIPNQIVPPGTYSDTVEIIFRLN